MITKKEQKALTFIEQFQATHGYLPTVRELQEKLGLYSSSTAHGYLVRLEKKGYIKRRSSGPMAYMLISERESVHIPKELLDRILMAAKHESCKYEDDDPCPTWHCCDWTELVDEIEGALKSS